MNLKKITSVRTSIKSNKSKPKLNRAQVCILYFFLFAFIGWLMETLYAIYNLGHFTKRGFLYGPICPIYGYGALILLIFLRKYKKNSIQLFVIAAIIFTVFEYLVSFGLDALFAMHWWDYTQDFMNLNGRVSIFYTFAWGFIAIFFLNHIHPFFKKKINLLLSKIPYTVQSISLKMIFVIFIVDTILSCICYVM